MKKNNNYKPTFFEKLFFYKIDNFLMKYKLYPVYYLLMLFAIGIAILYNILWPFIILFMGYIIFEILKYLAYKISIYRKHKQTKK